MKCESTDRSSPTAPRTVAVLSMLHEPAAMHSGARPFRETTVLDHTLSRLAEVGGVEESWVICWDDQAAAVAPVANAQGAIVLVKSPRQPIPQLDAICAARRWSDGWRGGLLRTTCYDAGWHGESALEVLDESAADAAVLVDPAAAFVDPIILGRLISRWIERPDLAYTFAPAAPGLGGMLLTRACVDSLIETNRHPGRLLSFDPKHPARDVLADATCVEVPTDYARTTQTFLLDCDRTLRRGTGVPPASAISVEERRGREARATEEPMPREVTLELTARRATDAIDSPGRHLVVERPDLSPETAATLFAELGRIDDLRLTLAGVGDPLLHPRFADIVRAAKSAGITAVGIETDLLPDSPEVLDALPALGLDVVSFRLPAMLPATYAAVMGADRMADALRNLKRLLIARKTNGTSTPLLVPVFTKCRENLPEMEAWYDHWLGTLDGAVIRGPTTCGGQIPDAAVADMSPPRRAPCRRIESRLTVLCDGRVTTCEEDVRGAQPLGRVGEHSIADLWRGAMRWVRGNHRLQIFEETPVCADCKDWHRP